MIVVLLIKKTTALFLIMCMGMLLVKKGILNAGDSRVISAISIHLILPCVILNAFQVEFSPEVKEGLFLSLAAAVIINVGLIVLVTIFSGILRLDAVEQVSVIYSNAGNLVIPIVSAILGSEWVIYSSVFLAVQMFLIWSHGKMVLCGEKKPDLKKVFANINMLAIALGILSLISGLHFPGPVKDAIDSVGGMVGPLAMLVTGMLIASMDFRAMLSYKRIWLVTFLRLLLCPALVLAVVKYSGMASWAAAGDKILLITLIACITPSASTITQMAQIYGQNADYASAINVITTILCIVTMPVLVLLYQM